MERLVSVETIFLIVNLLVIAWIGIERAVKGALGTVPGWDLSNVCFISLGISFMSRTKKSK